MGTSLINGKLKVKTKEDIDRLENLLVVQNRVKKGIEIPEIEVTLDEVHVTFQAIDKMKYADFLALNPIAVVLYENTESGYDNYIGDELEFLLPESNIVDKVLISFEQNF
jgi:hypothetical protein